MSELAIKILVIISQICDHGKERDIRTRNFIGSHATCRMQILVQLL